MEAREITINNIYEQVRKKEYALNEREDALIQKEADLNFNSERRIKTIREAMEQERKQLKQEEEDIETRIRVEVYTNVINELQKKVADILKE